MQPETEIRYLIIMVVKCILLNRRLTFVVVVIEISLITPPIGLNVFVLNAMLPDIRLTEIFRGVLPFVAADLVRVALIVFIPALSLYLPSFME